jgi:hypothetical protein
LAEQDLDSLWKQILERIGELGLKTFPSIPDRIDAEWPDRNWQAFLELGVACGCRLVYLEKFVLDRDEVEDARPLFEGPDGRTAETFLALNAALASAGRASRIELAFAVDGVIHRWMQEASWLADWDQILGEANGPHWRQPEAPATENYRAEVEALESQIEGWATTLSRDPSFLSGVNQGVRRGTAYRLIPELNDWIREGQRPPITEISRARQRAAWDVLGRAEELLPGVKRKMIEAAVQTLDSWADDLLLDDGFRSAGSSDERKRRAGEFVMKRLGFASPDVRDQLITSAKRRDQ